MLHEIPKDVMEVSSSAEEYGILEEMKERRLYLNQPIQSLGFEESVNFYLSTISGMVKFIMDCNREDQEIEVGNRKPIKIYINSPGGEVTEGFPLVSAIELSKTPVYTYNVGQWSSMAFLIGITGHKRISMPNMKFLMHEGESFFMGTTGKVKDAVKFESDFEEDVIKPHVLGHSKMTEKVYDSLSRVEFYMLPDMALEYGFIDMIASNMEEIL